MQRPNRTGETNMDILTTLLAVNTALCAAALVGFALTKESAIEAVRNTFSGVNVAGIFGAAFGLVTVSSVGAMFL
jgi:hypothetical protein